jgi:uncharacterized protein
VIRRVLIDTGPLVAIGREDDEFHDACVEQAKQIVAPMLTCWPVITEAAWPLRSHSRALPELLGQFGKGTFAFCELGAADMPAIAVILKRYDSIGLQLADACIVHLAERENIDTIFTLDRRDFGAVRVRGKQRLNLIPPVH